MPFASPSLRQPVDPVGIHALRSGLVAIGLGLAFGHADSAALEDLARAAAIAGGAGLRTAPGRVLLVVGLDADRVSQLVDVAERFGFLVHA